jgi:microcystin-dependent protein
MPIQQNTALFSLLGTTFGGNGTSNFGLPNLMGNIPLHVGRNQPGPGLSVYDLGEMGGSTTVTLLEPRGDGDAHPLADGDHGERDVSTSANNQPARAFVGNLQGNTQGLFYSTVATPATQLPVQTIGPPWAATSRTTT